MMVSQLRRCSLVDRQDRRAKLVDLAVDLADGDYPPVTRLLFHDRNKEPRAVPWAAVESIDLPERVIKVADLEVAASVSPELLDHLVLLWRDIQDALVLDLEQRRATRANDLWLEVDQGCLRLCAADVSPLAIFRRLSRDQIMPGRQLYDWKYIEFLRGDPAAARAGADYHRRIAYLPPGDIAGLSDALPYLHAAELLTLLPDALAADTLEAMTSERQVQVFEELPEDQARRLLGLAAPDIVADLLARLEPTMARHYLEHLPPKQQGLVLQLLRYPEHTVGAIMSNAIVSVAADLTVGEAQCMVRERIANPDFVQFVYVISDHETRRLCGVISLRRLLLADELQPLSAVMCRHLVTLHDLDSARNGAQRVLTSQLAALPVVNRDERLVGVVTIDVAIAQGAPSRLRSQVPRVFA